jgi:hypothetical protein
LSPRRHGERARRRCDRRLAAKHAKFRGLGQGVVGRRLFEAGRVRRAGALGCQATSASRLSPGAERRSSETRRACASRSASDRMSSPASRAATI